VNETKWSNLSQKDKFNSGMKYGKPVDPGETGPPVKIKVQSGESEIIKPSNKRTLKHKRK